MQTISLGDGGAVPMCVCLSLYYRETPEKLETDATHTHYAAILQLFM